MRPLLAAIAAAVLIVPMFLSAIALAVSGLERAVGDVWVLIPVMVVSFAHVSVIGLPAFALLRRIDRANPYAMAITGFLGALVPMGSLQAYLRTAPPMADEWLQIAGVMALWSTLGMVSALAFWYAWVYSCKVLGPIQHGRKQLVK